MDPIRPQIAPQPRIGPHIERSFLAEKDASASSSDSMEQVAREQALALDYLSDEEASPAAAQPPLSERRVRWLSRNFCESFNLKEAHKRATKANDEEKRILLQEAARAYESLYEGMTFWDVADFWGLVAACSPCSLPMTLEAKHVKKIAWLSMQQIQQEEDKIEMTAMIHALGSLVANHQIKIKTANATRTMNPCAVKILSELVFLFAQSLKPEEGKQWGKDSLAFMTLLVQQMDAAFDCGIDRITDMFLSESFSACKWLELCLHLVRQDSTFSSVRAFGQVLRYSNIAYEVPAGFDPSLWKCAGSLDLARLDEEAIKDLLNGLFHKHPSLEARSLAEPVAFLQKWAALLSQTKYRDEVCQILDWLRRAPDFPAIWLKIKDKYKDVEGAT